MHELMRANGWRKEHDFSEREVEGEMHKLIG